MTPIRRTSKTTRNVLLVALALLALPFVAAQAGSDLGGVLVRVDGDIRIGPNETVEVLVLVGEGSHADVAGTVGVAVVVGGTLNLTGTVVDQLVLMNGHATLHNGSVVQGDVSTTDSTVDERPGSRVEGTTEEGGFDRVAPLVSIVFGAIFLIGVPLALVVAGLVSAWLFPRQLRTVGQTLRHRIGPSVLAGVALWLALPLAAFLLLFTLIGIPLAIGILVVLLPILWVVGFIAAATKVGDLILTNGGKKAPAPRPYGAAALGVVLLLLVGLLPFIGSLIVMLAGMYGSGGLVLAALRSARQTPPGGRPPVHYAAGTPSGQQPPASKTEEHPWDPGAGGA